VRDEERHIEYLVLSYVPQAVSERKYNVGLLALEQLNDRKVLLGTRFIRDTTGLLDFDPHADVDVLFSLFDEIEDNLREGEDGDALLRTMLDSFSNAIQISDQKNVVVSGDPVDEIDRLAALYVYQP
jgi:hypothetical protein